MKFYSYVLSSLLIFSQLSAITINDSVKEIIDTNPVVQERLRNYRSTQQDLGIADSGYLPTIDIVGGVGWKTQGHLNSEIAKDDFNMYNSALVLRQNLFNGFDTLYRTGYEKTRVLSAAYAYVEKADDIALQAVDAYINILRANELYETAKENVANNELIYSKVYELYVSGAAARSELDKIQSSLSLARSNLSVKRNNLIDSRYNLHRLLGRNVSVQALVKPKFISRLPQNRIRALQFAIEHNPSLMVARNNLKGAQELYKQSRATYYPSLDFEASQNYSENWQTSTSPDDRFELMLKLNYNLYNGGKDSATKQKNISKVNQEVENMRELKREVIHSLGLAWNAKEIIKVQLDDLYKFQSYSFSTLELYQEEYELGQRSLLDLLAAQNDFFNSQTQIINAEYDRLYAKYRILDAMGVLVVSLLGDEVEYYKTVGLFGENNETIVDELPINFDIDGDTIVDDQDLCTNSEIGSSVMPYGCTKFVEDKDGDGVSNDYDLCPNTPLGFSVNIDGCPLAKNLDLIFKPLSNEIAQASYLKIEQLVRFLTENPLYNVMIVGHTDNVGTNEENDLLSKQRAVNVKNALIKLGINEVRLGAIGMGESTPIADNSTPEGRRKNRRTEIKLDYIKDVSQGAE